MNHLKSALRSIRKQKIYSFINIAGLSVGLCACLIVATVVIDDLSYDKDWRRSNDIYRIVTVNDMGEGMQDRMATSFAGLAPELKKNYPEVESFAPFSSGKLRLKMKDIDDQGVDVNVLNTDSAVWDLLDFTILSGDPGKFVAGQPNIVITESFRRTHFADVNPVGKIIEDVPAYSDKPVPYLITGIIKDIPGNTHLRADIVRINPRRQEELNKSQWGTFSQNYILLKPGTDIKNFGARVNAWYKKFVEVPKPYQFEFQPIRNVYLDSPFANYQKVKGNRQNIYIFSGVALLLLLIACVNFVNLSTARSFARLRETGVRKVLGATRGEIMKKLLTEALLVFIIAGTIAIFLYQLTLVNVESWLGHELVQTFVTKTPLFIVAIASIILIGLLTGFYPAWLISRFRTAPSLKGKISDNHATGQQWLRKGLVVLQFSISILVLLAMMVVQQQLNFMNKSDLGFDKENLLNIGSISWDGKGNAFRNELMKLNGVKSASITSWYPSSGAGYMSREIDDPNRPGAKMTVWYVMGDIHLGATLGLTVQSGRLLKPEFSTDAMNEDSLREHDEKKYNQLSEVRPALLTATTAKLLQVSQLNKPLPNVKTVPVGIISDFHNQSLHEKLGATIVLAEANPQYGGMLIRVNAGTNNQVMRSIQQLWRRFFPSKLLDLNWVDDLVATQYEPERKLRELFTFFSLLTMILASLGIFGLVVHAAQQRVKEIGVRKVLGASVGSIFGLLSGEFVRLIIAALVISSPIAWWLMNGWLENYSYRIQIPIWIFGVAGAVTIAAAILTVSFQSLKAALANPVESLRNE